MKVLDVNVKPIYIESPSEKSMSKRSVTSFSAVQAIFAFALALVMALSIVSPALITLSSGSSSSAYADEDEEDKKQADEIKDKIKDAAKSSGISTDQKGFEDVSNDLPAAGTREDSFKGLLSRMFTFQYLNNVESGVASKGEKKPESGYLCSTNNEAAGTPIYHNCDIPNLAAEFAQGVVATFSDNPAQYASVDYAGVDNPAFGLPSNIPQGTVPEADSIKSVKYSGLELFGYNLKYSLYRGEWDQIKVMTRARALSNFGFSDRMKLGVASIMGGISGAVEGAKEGANEAVSNLKQGDIIGAIGSGFSAFSGGGIAGSINTILDTSDLNVVNKKAWYRVGYGSTLYNARELSNDELSILQKELMQEALIGTGSDKVKIPDDLKMLSSPPQPPKRSISKCEVLTADGGYEEKLISTNPPGPTKADCDKEAKKARKSDPKAKWDQNGRESGVSLQRWRDENKDWFAAAKKYGLKCSIDIKDEKNFTKNYSTFDACVSSNYPDVAREKSGAIKDEEYKKWADSALSNKVIGKLLSSAVGGNFNAPWLRYVCTTPEGKDILDGNGSWVAVYRENGELTGNCSGVRPPIQNGLFGNGYDITKANQNPGVDTRYERLDTGIFGILFPVDSIVNVVSNFGLTLATFFTRVSNTALNLSFSPVLQAFGFDKVVVSLVEDFRESIFMPLSLIFIGFGAIWIFVQGSVTRRYSQQFMSLVFIALTFTFGLVLMLKPQKFIEVVDKTPAAISAAVTGSIYGAAQDNSDDLCTVSGTPASEKEGITSAVSNANRTMLCENWRANAFNPWLAGQWGTSYENLYSQPSGKPNHLDNTNQQLVGDAGVYMGGGHNEKNWALYQLDVTTAGTGTEKIPTAEIGTVPRDFYRIVDAQAGPNNGAGTDGRYFDTWSGKGSAIMTRLGAGTMAPITSFFSMVTIVAYSFQKIILSFVVVGMGIAIPFVFLLGLFPSMRILIKNFFGNLIGLIIQQVLLVGMLAVLMKVLTAFGNSTSNIFLAMLLVVATCLIFLFNRKSWTDGIMRIFNSGKGNHNFINQSMKQRFQSAPKFVRQPAETLAAGTVGAAGGAIGGYLSGGRSGIVSGAQRAASVNMDRADRGHRRQGFSLGRTVSDTASQVGESTRKKQERSLEDSGAFRDLESRTQNAQKEIQEQRLENQHFKEVKKEVKRRKAEERRQAKGKGLDDFKPSVIKNDPVHKEQKETVLKAMPENRKYSTKELRTMSQVQRKLEQSEEKFLKKAEKSGLIDDLQTTNAKELERAMARYNALSSKTTERSTRWAEREMSKITQRAAQEEDIQDQLAVFKSDLSSLEEQYKKSLANKKDISEKAMLKRFENARHIIEKVDKKEMPGRFVRDTTKRAPRARRKRRSERDS